MTLKYQRTHFCADTSLHINFCQSTRMHFKAKGQFVKMIFLIKRNSSRLFGYLKLKNMAFDINLLIDINEKYHHLFYNSFSLYICGNNVKKALHTENIFKVL